MEKKIIDQELEDAAGKHADKDTLDGEQAYKSFKAGANWQKEQSANDAIGFGKWIMRQKFGHLAGKSYKELYREYQKIKENADN